MNELSFADNLFLLAVYLTGGGAAALAATAVAGLFELLDKRRCERAEAHTAEVRREREREQIAIGAKVQREMLMERLGVERTIQTVKIKPLRKATGLFSDAAAQAVVE